MAASCTYYLPTIIEFSGEKKSQENRPLAEKLQDRKSKRTRQKGKKGEKKERKKKKKKKKKRGDRKGE